MEVESLSQYIKLALDLYDDKYINNIEVIKGFTNEISFVINNKKFYYEYELLGYFDNMSQIWLWGWVLNMDSDKSHLANKLLQYGLTLEPTFTDLSEHYMLKSLFVNSRIMIEEVEQLEINIALASYCLKDNIQFILPYKKYLDENKKTFITEYLLIK